MISISIESRGYIVVTYGKICRIIDGDIESNGNEFGVAKNGTLIKPFTSLLEAKSHASTLSLNPKLQDIYD